MFRGSEQTLSHVALKNAARFDPGSTAHSQRWIKYEAGRDVEVLCSKHPLDPDR